MEARIFRRFRHMDFSNPDSTGTDGCWTASGACEYSPDDNNADISESEGDALVRADRPRGNARLQSDSAARRMRIDSDSTHAGNLVCRNPQGNVVGRSGSHAKSGWLAGLILAAMLPKAGAQEIPRPSTVRQRSQQALPSVYNFRIGPVQMRVDAGLTTEFVDNVDLSPTGSPDLIITPEIGVNATWAVTKLNTLRFRASVGYSNYLNHPRLNQQTVEVSPDSALAFDLYVGDVRINFHEQFSLQDQTINQGALSGVAQIGRFTNTAGINFLWDMNEVVLTAGYDHFNFITTSAANASGGTVASNISQLDHSTDQISASASFKLTSVSIGGIEATASASTYPKTPSADFDSLSAGPFLEIQLTKYTHLYVSGGIKTYSNSGGSPGSVSLTSAAPPPTQGGTPAGFYANVSLLHTLNRFYNDRLEFTHSDEADALNGHVQLSALRYQGTWRVNSKLSVVGGLFFEDAHEISGSALNGAVPADYQRWGGSLGTAYHLTEHLDLGLGYQYTNKHSPLASQDYRQNSVRITPVSYTHLTLPTNREV